MLVSHCRHLELVEGETFGPALVVRDAAERLVPVLMTALTSGLALLPLVWRATSQGTRSSIRWPLSSSAARRRRRCSTYYCCPRYTCGSAGGNRERNRFVATTRGKVTEARTERLCMAGRHGSSLLLPAGARDLSGLQAGREPAGRRERRAVGFAPVAPQVLSVQ